MDANRREVLKGGLPAGKKLTVAVRPCSSLGTKGKAIAAKYVLRG